MKKTSLQSNLAHFIRTEDGLNESKLSEKTGIPQPTINRLVKGQTPDPRISTVHALAEYFKVGSDELMGYQLFNPHGKTRYCPVLTLDAVASDTQFIKSLDMDEWPSWVSVNCKSISELAFAIKVENKNFEAPLLENALQVIDPAVKPLDNDYCVVSLGDKAYFKRLIMDGSSQYVCSPITGFSVEPLGEQKIIGTVIETIISNRTSK